jgi:hypothetical protein
MPRTRHLYIFKCFKGHQTEKTMPLGTPLENQDEVVCSECLKNNILATAYVVFICPEPKSKENGGSRP